MDSVLKKEDLEVLLLFEITKYASVLNPFERKEWATRINKTSMAYKDLTGGFYRLPERYKPLLRRMYERIAKE